MYTLPLDEMNWPAGDMSTRYSKTAMRGKSNVRSECQSVLAIYTVRQNKWHQRSFFAYFIQTLRHMSCVRYVIQNFCTQQEHHMWLILWHDIAQTCTYKQTTNLLEKVVYQKLNIYSIVNKIILRYNFDIVDVLDC